MIRTLIHRNDNALRIPHVVAGDEVFRLSLTVACVVSVRTFSLLVQPLEMPTRFGLSASIPSARGVAV